MRFLSLLGVLIVLALVLAGCAQDSPVETLETYLQAKVDSDLDVLLSLSCADWEAQAIVEASSFESMNAELQGMSCQQTGQDGDYILIECQGQIVTVYNGETREWDLGAFPYRLIQEDGEWKMCGYAEGGR
jgi:hypothetical protein